MNLEVTTHDGEVYNITVTEFSAAEINESLNDETLNTVAIGDLVVARINVKSVYPRSMDEG